MQCVARGAARRGAAQCRSANSPPRLHFPPTRPLPALAFPRPLSPTARAVVITAKGQPDVATRLFLRKLKTELRLPVLGLVDADPYGLKILSVYMSGSKNMSYDSANLTTPDIKWLGIRPSDLDRYGIPDQCRLPMTPGDLKVGAELLKEEFITSNPAWVKELQAMCAMKVKAEIQSLSSFDFQCVGRGARRRAAAAHTCRAAPTPTRARVPLRFTRRRRRRRAGTSRTRT